jgi:hypothetical protein
MQGSGEKEHGLTDYGLGFRNVIVVYTAAEKIFGINSESGEIIWHTFVSNKSFKKFQKFIKIYQVDGTHEGLLLQAVSNKNDAPILIKVDPFTG